MLSGNLFLDQDRAKKLKLRSTCNEPWLPLERTDPSYILPDGMKVCPMKRVYNYDVGAIDVHLLAASYWC